MFFDVGGISGGGGHPQVDPDTYAQQYAQANGISLEEAKNQLKAKYGDPQKPQGSGFANDVTVTPEYRGAMNMNAGLLQFSGEGANFTVNPFGAMPSNPEQLEQFVKDGAMRMGVSEKEFAQMLGLPDRNERNETDKTQLLRELGIPENIIEQGDDAIRKYAHDHDIDLPAKEKR